MENWFNDVGKPALLEALVGAFGQVENKFADEITPLLRERSTFLTELELLRTKAAKANQYEEENRALKTELQNLKQSASKHREANSTHAPRQDNRFLTNPRTPLAPRSVNAQSTSRRSIQPKQTETDILELPELKKEYDRVNDNYTKLHEKYLELGDAHSETIRLLRERTKAYQQWVGHAQTLEEIVKSRTRKIGKLEAKLAEVTPDPLSSSFPPDGPHPPSMDGRNRNRGLQSNAASEALPELGVSTPDPVPRLSPVRWPPAAVDRAGIHLDKEINSGGESTQGNEDLISRKTPASASSANESEDFSALPPMGQLPTGEGHEIQIKNEPSSDTPVIVSARCIRNHKDDDTHNIHSPIIPRLKTEQSSAPVFADGHRLFVPHESIDFDAQGLALETPRKRKKYLHSGENRTQRRSRDSSDSHDFEQSNIDFQPNPSSLLQVRDNNDSRQPKSAAEPSRKRRRIPEAWRDAGDIGPDQPSEASKKDTERRPILELLKERLPECATPISPTIAQSRTAPTKDASPSKPNRFQVAAQRIPTSNKEGVKKINKGLQTPGTPLISNNKRTSAAIQPRSDADTRPTRNDRVRAVTPLRERRRSRLRLDDFKINPKTNEGLDYAYTDVVRKKDQRASLAGCVKEGCCGESFRELARAERFGTKPLAFQSLLESYLGDDAHKLGSMSREEKEAMWLDAKTRDIANSHGRHRHRHQRMRSPPGFWRTDFPSTQEAEDEKEEAAKMERDMIDERYREAMRPGGQWLFRDE
ncbi:DNA repair protein endonuclease SAE2/CtIP C-terminus-domain-containing protein [Xylariomycetidae sp. FL2044]|nr:DNA repair protein endonuclease SAE2/CtIP C-terminus-domain-containing protein [Xylariomycetidae sp. FL2044]